MSSVQYLREFVSERLTAAAEEIFGVFEQTIVEYEAEIDRQRRLLDIVWKPEIKLHRIELPQQHVCKEEEVLTDQQLWNQHRNSSLDPEPPQVKEEQEEVCTSQEGEQLVLKQETQTFMLTRTHEESEHSEPEPNRDHQLLSHCSAAAENQDQRGGQHVDPGPTRDAESMTKKRRHNNRRHRNKVDNSATTKSLCETHTDQSLHQDPSAWGLMFEAVLLTPLILNHVHINHVTQRKPECKTLTHDHPTKLYCLNKHTRPVNQHFIAHIPFYIFIIKILRLSSFIQHL
ncbi:uncharacterized protein LOC121193440 isoform X2 [Toxotes jaculatrix]|uniref:uncharacterized protein LOC121193440 isoform X2 n=1 Tax=Toxotes jaculatrix TaxID=941984 RepID=UPI001B3AD270|nr:uncharacterized protein LOC121193440 isoform X2 [Toxotes jaculatrix]